VFCFVELVRRQIDTFYKHQGAAEISHLMNVDLQAMNWYIACRFDGCGPGSKEEFALGFLDSFGSAAEKDPLRILCIKHVFHVGPSFPR
jgi:hypothetical protein